jgi:hypothetical protein
MHPESHPRLAEARIDPEAPMSSHPNPYEPPKAEVADITVVGSEAESIRREHIKHESSIRSVGALYYLGGGLMIVSAIGLLAASTLEPNSIWIGISAVYVVLGVFSWTVAWHLRRLKNWARVAAIVLSCIGLLGFPLGTIINAYILYLLLSQKGRRIFQADYVEIVDATPHIRYRTSILVWIVLAILIVGIIAAVSIPMLANR